MSDPIRIDITTAREILGQDYTFTDDGDNVLDPGDSIINFKKSVEERESEVIAKTEKDAFFDFSNPEKFLELLERGSKQTSLVTGEYGGKVFLVTSEKSYPHHLGAIYEIGDFVKIKDQFTDAITDKKIDLNFNEAESALFVNFEYETLKKSCESPKYIGHLKSSCVDDLREYETQYTELQKTAAAAKEAYWQLSSSYEEQDLTGGEVEDFILKQKSFHDALKSYQKSKIDFSRAYQKSGAKAKAAKN